MMAGFGRIVCRCNQTVNRFETASVRKIHSFYHGYETRVSAQGIEFRIRPQPDHPATTKFLHDTVVRNGFADQRVGGWHVPHILSCSPKQVNERRLAAQTARNVLASLKYWNE
jgi:hypothetical protein